MVGMGDACKITWFSKGQEWEAAVRLLGCLCGNYLEVLEMM